MIVMATWGVGAIEESDDTVVFWRVRECWIKLSVHPDVDMGEADFSIGYLESTGNPVRVITNCPGWKLFVEATDTTSPPEFTGAPDDDPPGVLGDFNWRAGSCTPPAENAQPTYTTFPGLDERMGVASSGVPATSTCFMDYKYELDVYDIPGDYSVTLLYTVTSP
jgi:hypothetical protein